VAASPQRDTRDAPAGERHVGALERRERDIGLGDLDECHVDVVLGELATRRFPVASADELGLSRSAIRHLVARGRLRQEFRGVYALGPAPLPPLALEAAALIAGGEGSALFARSARAAYELGPSVIPVEVAVRTNRRSRPRLHVVRRVVDDVRTPNGLHATTPQQTALDLAGVVDERELRRFVAGARVKRLLPLGAFPVAPGAPGAPALRAVLDDGPGLTRSAAERMLRKIASGAGLPPPETNVVVLGRERDAVWRAQRLVVEIDSWQFHGHREAFEGDRHRDQDLIAAGWRVLRFTARQLRDEPLRVAALLALALAQPSR